MTDDASPKRLSFEEFKLYYEQRLNYLLDAAFLPQSPKDKLRSNPQYRHRFSVRFSLSGGVRID
jgi:hypothetical protein